MTSAVSPYSSRLSQQPARHPPPCLWGMDVFPDTNPDIHNAFLPTHRSILRARSRLWARQLAAYSLVPFKGTSADFFSEWPELDVAAVKKEHPLPHPRIARRQARQCTAGLRLRGEGNAPPKFVNSSAPCHGASELKGCGHMWSPFISVGGNWVSWNWICDSYALRATERYQMGGLITALQQRRRWTRSDGFSDQGWEGAGRLWLARNEPLAEDRTVVLRSL